MLTAALDIDSLAKVRKVPLFRFVEKDVLNWKPSVDGIFLVKTAYRFCMDNNILDTNYLQVPGDWNTLWRIKAPPKIKNLLWRACRDCIPNRVRLQNRGVLGSLIVLSVMWIWRAIGMYFFPVRLVHLAGKSWVCQVLWSDPWLYLKTFWIVASMSCRC